jgi:4-hydroxybenzoate polyprenyltransferase
MKSRSYYFFIVFLVYFLLSSVLDSVFFFISIPIYSFVFLIFRPLLKRYTVISLVLVCFLDIRTIYVMKFAVGESVKHFLLLIGYNYYLFWVYLFILHWLQLYLFHRSLIKLGYYRRIRYLK